MDEDQFMINAIEVIQAMQAIQAQRYRYHPERGLELIQESDEPTSVSSITSSRKNYDTFFTGDIKPCVPKHEICIISLEPIEPGELYHQCAKCHQSISIDGMREWWNTCQRSNQSVTCPACREIWTDSKLYLYSLA